MVKKTLAPLSLAILFLFLAGLQPARAYRMTDYSLVPVTADRLVPFEPLKGSLLIYLPATWNIKEEGEHTWRFTASGKSGIDPVSAELRTGPTFRGFREFADEIVPPDGQGRVIGPIGFPDKFDDNRERYFIHFIKNGQMMSAIYGSMTNAKERKYAAIELVFNSDAFDYYDALSYTLICNIRLPDDGAPTSVYSFLQWQTVYECYALAVPLGQKTPEEAVTSYYGCLITNRWEKARSYLSTSIDKWPPCYDIAYKERSWWALKWFKLLFMCQYADRVEISILKDVRQLGEDQEGVDCVTLKKIGSRWFIASFP
jgi:hypothetical protein